MGEIRRLIFDKFDGSGGWWANGSGQINSGIVALLTGMRPVADGAGAALVPAQRNTATAGVPLDTRSFAVQYNGGVYFSAGSKLYKMTATANLFTGYADQTFPGGTITDMVVHDSLIYICNGGGNIRTYDGTTFVDVTATLGGANLSNNVGSYNGVLFWRGGTADTLNWRVIATPANYSRILGAGNIRRILGAAGSLWVGCQGGLFRLRGTLKAGNPTTLPGKLDIFEPDIVQVLVTDFNLPSGFSDQNFSYMQAAHGYLWFWANGRVYRVSISEAGGPGRPEVEPQPIYGKLRGMAICDGLVVVCVDSGGFRYLWAWELGRGWWLINSGGNTSTNWNAPFSGLAVAKDAAVCALQSNELNLARFPLDNSYLMGRNSNTFALVDASQQGFIDLPALGPDDLGRGGSNPVKTARPLRLTAVWGIPFNLTDGPDFTNYITGGSSAGAITFEFWISTNAGASWVMLGTYAPPTYNDFSNGRNVWEIPAALGEAIALGGNQPGFWQFRLSVVGPYAPVVKRIILDVEIERLK